MKDPNNPRKRIYRVFDKIETSKTEDDIIANKVKASGRVDDNKALRASTVAALTKKVSAGGGNSLDEMC